MLADGIPSGEQRGCDRAAEYDFLRTHNRICHRKIIPGLKLQPVGRHVVGLHGDAGRAHAGLPHGKRRSHGILVPHLADILNGIKELLPEALVERYGHGRASAAEKAAADAHHIKPGGAYSVLNLPGGALPHAHDDDDGGDADDDSQQGKNGARLVPPEILERIDEVLKHCPAPPDSGGNRTGCSRQGCGCSGGSWHRYAGRASR